MVDRFIYSGPEVPIGGTVGQILTKVGAPNYYTAWRDVPEASGTNVPGSGVLSLSTSGSGLSGSAYFSANAISGVTFVISSNATSANVNNALVARNASGGFSAGTIIATLSGVATSANTWTTGRTITLSGDISGTSGSFDGSANLAFSTAIASNVIVNADVNTAAAIAYSKLNLSSGITNTDVSASAAIVDTKLATISTASKVSNSATTATALNTPNAIVARDVNGDFSAGTIDATIDDGTY
jgi:hypothetical protein